MATSQRSISISEFCRISPRLATEIIARSGLRKDSRARSIDGQGAKAIYTAIQDARILAPATDCVVPIGEEQLLSGLKEVLERSRKF